MAYGEGLNRLPWATENGVWLTAIPHCLNGTELSWEEFQYNLLLQYDIVPLNLPKEFDAYGNKFLVPHALSCPKWDFVLARHNDATKESGALSAQDINLSFISYEPKINNRTVQGERNRSGARVAMVEQEGGGTRQ